MLFGRRDKPSMAERIRIFLWPRRNWMRSGKYFVKRILRLSGSPYMIAAGVAAGVFTSFTPFLGFHFLISWAIAFLIGGNMLAAAIGTGVGNPITFPFIWGATYTTGCFLLGKEAIHGQLHSLKHDLLTESFSTIWPTIQVMAVGAIPVGLVFALIFYYVTRKAALVYQKRRKAMLAERAYEAGRWRKAIAEHDGKRGKAQSA
ncbi:MULTISPECIES: DUF2062 domain-containing protein [Cohaesibacter]|uniref:DUF2062 domain-containing protein n=1 Tax=Cohaesibacter TaxID=655352 RepID=UPI001FDF5512|nr:MULTISPECIES: DUF2062 domain-containing protein [Cohaesibacter]